MYRSLPALLQMAVARIAKGHGLHAKLHQCLTIALISALILPAYSHSATPRNLLVLGDSLSSEYGLVRGTGWVALLAERINSERLPYRVINSSISGDTTAGGSTRLPDLLRRHNPVIVIIELGGNDALRGLALRATEDNLRAMIDAVRSTEAQTLLVGMRVPPNYGKNYSGKFEAIFKRIAAEKRVIFLPFLLDGFGENTSFFQADQIHPNEDAQRRILENVWPSLRPLLKQ